jgi:hypothetical protein
MINLRRKIRQIISESLRAYSGKEMASYITDITPEESDVPDYFINQLIKTEDRFFLRNLSIGQILSKDDDVKEYVMSDEERYGDEEIDYRDLDLPIVIFNDKVFDGYNRLKVKFDSGEEYIMAYTNKN